MNEVAERTNQQAALAQRAYRIRRYALRMGEVQGQGYIGQALGMSDILAVAYGHALNYRPDDPKWEGRDRFLLSHGHYAIAFYAALIEAGVIPESELETYGADDSRLPMSGMATYTPGMEMSGGLARSRADHRSRHGAGSAPEEESGVRLQLHVGWRARRRVDLGSRAFSEPLRSFKPDLLGRHQQPAGGRPVDQGARLRAARRQVGVIRMARCSA
jgi:hypothetical protein